MKSKITKKVIVLRGLPYSGKTKWAHDYAEKHEKTVVFNYSVIKKSLGKTALPSIVNEMAIAFLRASMSIDYETIIIAEPYFDSSYLNEIIEAISDFNDCFDADDECEHMYGFELETLDTSVVDCVKAAKKAGDDLYTVNMLYNINKKYMKGGEMCCPKCGGPLTLHVTEKRATLMCCVCNSRFDTETKEVVIDDIK